MAIELPPLALATPPPGYPGDWVVPSVGDIESYERIRRHGLVPMHAEVLRQRAAPIAIGRIVVDGGPIVRKLQDVVQAELAAGRRVAGLAAPQAGEGKRVIFVRLPGRQETLAMINPVATDASTRTSEWSEGCLTTRMGGPIERPVALQVAHYDEYGNYYEPQWYEDDDARILGHELDHLDGVLVYDRIAKSGSSPLWIHTEYVAAGREAAYNAWVRQPEPKEPWPYVVPLEQLQAWQLGHITMEEFAPPSSA